MLPEISIQKPMKLERREFLFAAGFFAVGLTSSHSYAKPAASKRILFVCQYGTAKSVIAREFFRKRALRRGITVQAVSRGITIEDHISEGLRRNLAADGINPNVEAIQVLAPLDWQSADVVIAFNPLPPGLLHADIRDWSDLPSMNERYKKSRAILKRRIDKLLDEVAAR